MSWIIIVAPPSDIAISHVPGAGVPGNGTAAMSCAQVQDYIKKHGQTLLATGKESGNYSFDYADCGWGRIPRRTEVQLGGDLVAACRT